MNTLRFDEFLRSIKQNNDTKHSLLLGAGASVESGVPSAMDCIWDRKYEIFISSNPSYAVLYNNPKVESVRNAVQNWLDGQGIYPSRNSEEEYVFYAEKTYPIAEDRRKYFQHLVSDKNPSLGYHIIALLAQHDLIGSVWTTNFGGFCVKAAYSHGITPIEITLESEDRIYRNDTKRELLCVELHGDYKYGPLKNTEKELDSQCETLIKALSHEIEKRNLIVIGYSGRDKSLMDALEKAYCQPGSGRIYWCGYGSTCPKPVKELLEKICDAGRSAYYVPSDGFDKTMLLIAKHCMSNNTVFQKQLEKEIDDLGVDIEINTSCFENSSGSINKVVYTNLFPIKLPNECYQFQVSYPDTMTNWQYCRSLKSYNIISVPYNGMVYAWGDKEDILSVCGKDITGQISLTPFTSESIRINGAFKEMALCAVTAILAKISGLSCSRDKIWDESKEFFYNSEGQAIHAYFGVSLSIEFDEKYTYLSVNPSFEYKDKTIYSKSVKKSFSKYFYQRINGQSPNYNIYNSILTWINRILRNERVTISYPNQNSGFTFGFLSKNMYIGITNSKKSFNLSEESEKRAVHKGFECPDVNLLFYNPITNKNAEFFHPMIGLKNNAPFDYLLNNNVVKSNINIGVLCPASHNREFYNFLIQLNSKHMVGKNKDYVVNYIGFYDIYKVGLDIPTPDSESWIDLSTPNTNNLENGSKELGRIIQRGLERLSSAQNDVILIYISKEYEPLTGFSNDDETYDLHDYIKAYAVQKNIATQFIREKTLESDKLLYCQIMWPLSLAIYVKSCRIPWSISGLNSQTAFAGIGYSVNKYGDHSEIVVGCSHVYSSDGQGLKYKLSKVNDVYFDNKRNPFLKEDEEILFFLKLIMRMISDALNLISMVRMLIHFP